MQILVSLVLIVSFGVSHLQARQSRDSQLVNEDLYCNACQAVVRETLELLKDSRSHQQIQEAFSKICTIKHLLIYEFPPPEMIKGCEAFLNDWKEETAQILQTRKGTFEVEDQVCLERTKACFGVNLKKRNLFEDHSIPIDKTQKMYFVGSDL